MTQSSEVSRALEAFNRIHANFRGFCRCEPNELNALCTHCYDFRDIRQALKNAERTEGLIKALEKIAVPALGGKAQQYIAQEALKAFNAGRDEGEKNANNS